MPLREGPIHRIDRCELGIHDELCQEQIAPNVPFPQDMQLLRMDLSNDISQIEVTFPNFRDIQAADLTQVTFFTACHGMGQSFIPRTSHMEKMPGPRWATNFAATIEPSAYASRLLERTVSSTVSPGTAKMMVCSPGLSETRIA